MSAIDLVSSSSEEDELEPPKNVTPVIKQPVFDVFPVITAEEVASIAKAIGTKATEAALKRVRKVEKLNQEHVCYPHTPHKTYSKTRTPHPVRHPLVKVICVTFT